MKVIELMEKLKEFTPETEVTVWADHGQVDFKADQVEKAHIHKDEWDQYMMEGSHPDDIEDPDDYITVCQIS